MTSTIKVNNIQNQCGQNIINENSNTITLGASGDTIALASGASQTGFGRTGTVDWNTTPKTTGTFSAVSGDGFFLNTSGGVITANLPAGVAGAIVSFADYAGTWQTNNVTVTPNGTDKIGSVNTSVTLDTEGQSVTFIFVDSTQGWINTMDSTSNVRGVSFICASVSGACNTLVTAPCCANTKIATFTGPGNFTVNSISNLTANNVVSHVVIAGGGGSGSKSSGGTGGVGGGGAGGYREVNSPSAPFSASPLDGYPTPGNRITVTAQGYPIVVGGGGTAGQGYPDSPNATVGGTGGVSTFDSITSAGGGGGGIYCVGRGAVAGGSGGGGGNGSSAPLIPGAAGNTPPTSPAQGSTGGNANREFNGPSFYQMFAGGGGGATGVGANGGPNSDSGQGGAGGAGATSSITGSPVARAGGGGGAGAGVNCAGNPIAGYGGAGGAGGGGGGQTTGRTGPNSVPWGPTTTGGAGTINTGGGGGGGGALGDAVTPEFGRPGGGGGSGIVKIRYKFQ